MNPSARSFGARSAVLLKGLTQVLLSVSFAWAMACTPEAPQPLAGEWDRIFSITPPELMRYGRAFAVDTLYFRLAAPDRGRSDAAARAADPFIEAGLLEFSRGQTPDGFQAEQRGFFYNKSDGFRLLKDGGLYPNRETGVLRPADSARFRFSGRPGTGFLLQDRDDEFTIVAPPLALVRELQLGLARYALYAGKGEFRGAGHSSRSAMLVFQRLYLPAANPFDEDARRLWASGARLWLAIQDEDFVSGGELLFVREAGSVLGPLFAGETHAGDGFTVLARQGRSGGPQGGFDFFPVGMDLAAAESGARFRGGLRLQSPPAADGTESGAPEPSPRCEFELSALHSEELFTISRASSQIAAMRGELKCPLRSYHLRGIMRAWPEEGSL